MQILAVTALVWVGEVGGGQINWRGQRTLVAVHWEKCVKTCLRRRNMLRILEQLQCNRRERKSMSRVPRRAKELQQVDGKQFGDQTLDQMKLIFSENNQRYTLKQYTVILYLLKYWKQGGLRQRMKWCFFSTKLEKPWTFKTHQFMNWMLRTFVAVENLG